MDIDIDIDAIAAVHFHIGNHRRQGSDDVAKGGSVHRAPRAFLGKAVIAADAVLVGSQFLHFVGVLVEIGGPVLVIVSDEGVLVQSFPLATGTATLNVISRVAACIERPVEDDVPTGAGAVGYLWFKGRMDIAVVIYFHHIAAGEQFISRDEGLYRIEIVVSGLHVAVGVTQTHGLCQVAAELGNQKGIGITCLLLIVEVHDGRHAVATARGLGVLHGIFHGATHFPHHLCRHTCHGVGGQIALLHLL